MRGCLNDLHEQHAHALMERRGSHSNGFCQRGFPGAGSAADKDVGLGHRGLKQQVTRTSHLLEYFDSVSSVGSASIALKMWVGVA